MRDASKARGVEHTGVFERRATPLAAMQRWPNALVILRRALRTPTMAQLCGWGRAADMGGFGGARENVVARWQSLQAFDLCNATRPTVRRRMRALDAAAADGRYGLCKGSTPEATPAKCAGVSTKHGKLKHGKERT